MNAQSLPLVSVAMTAYNSEKWLARALDSVLMQQTEFPVEVVIGDDCSKDGTVAVAKSYRERHPEMIRVLEREKKLGIQRNYYDTFEHCRGKYIAWLDADDYWTDPEKLAIQVATLEVNPTVMICGHLARWVSHEGEVKRERYPSIAAGRYGLDEILRHDFLPSPSVVYRNGIQHKLPEWYFDLAPTTDWPIYVLGALAGDIVLLDRTMADYMLTPDSAITGKGDLYWYQTDARFYDHIESVLPAEWRRLVRAEKGRRYQDIAYYLRQQGDFAGSRNAAIKAFGAPSLLDNVRSKTKALLAATVREAQWRVRGRRKEEPQN